MKWIPRLLIPLLLLLSGVTLGLGLVGPCMTIIPRIDGVLPFARFFIPPGITTPQRFSILTGIEAMWQQHHQGLAVLLAGFSVVFPTIKLAIMGYGHAVVSAGRRTGTAWWLAHHAGKFSMLDVLVVAVLIVAVKGLPGNTQIVIGWGLWSFAASVAFSMLAAILIAWAERHRKTKTQKSMKTGTADCADRERQKAF